jgi:hypothetical protein
VLYDIYMRALAIGWLLLLAGASQSHQQEEAREALLSRVIASMRRVLTLMPDYTCSETINRSIGDGTPLRMKTLERVRLQVGMIGGKELFSWPGAASFERDDPHGIVGGGLTGTGDFAGFSRAVFGGDSAEMTNGEEEVWAGVRTIRFRYSIPRSASGYVLRSGSHSAIVDYGGSFWVEPGSGQVVALEVDADSRRNQIPAELDMFDVKTLLEYKNIRIAGGEFPFPASSTLTVVHLRSSIVTSNHIEFAGCRQYTADSSIQFGEHRTVERIPWLPPLPAELPGDMAFDVALDEPIRAATAAAGDAVAATVLRSVKSGTLEIPKGAKFMGRILRVETDLDKFTTHARLGFSHLESGGRYFPLRARFVTFGAVRGVFAGAPRVRWINLRDNQTADTSEWAAKTDFTLLGKDGLLPRGFRMEWVTKAE